MAVSQELLNPTRLPIPELKDIPDEVEIVVVGAGITGIYVAQQLTDAGLPHHCLSR